MQTTKPMALAASTAALSPSDSPTSPTIARRAVLGRLAAAIGLGAATNVTAMIATRSATAPTAETVPVVAPVHGCDLAHAAWLRLVGGGWVQQIRAVTFLPDTRAVRPRSTLPTSAN
jgi:hypothetical protein